MNSGTIKIKTNNTDAIHISGQMVIGLGITEHTDTMLKQKYLK